MDPLVKLLQKRHSCHTKNGLSCNRKIHKVRRVTHVDIDAVPRSRVEFTVEPDFNILETLKTTIKGSAAPAPSTSELPTGTPLSTVGYVAGRLIFDDGDCKVDCTKVGLNGLKVPPYDLVGALESDALFILLVQKYSAFLHLTCNRFYNRFPCIIVLVSGRPDASVRFLFSKLRMEFNLPVLALVDCDPLSLTNAYLTTPYFKWLGLRPTDLDRHGVPSQCSLPMTKLDIKRLKALLKNDDFVKKNPDTVRDLTLMLRTRHKTEIEALSSLGLTYLYHVYLPLKLQEKDWI